jgi:hypothetical protein
MSLLPIPSWTIQFDDGERIVTESASGKLSLDSSWAFVLDTQSTPPTIVLAVPRDRIITVIINEDELE